MLNSRSLHVLSLRSWPARCFAGVPMRRSKDSLALLPPFFLLLGAGGGVGRGLMLLGGGIRGGAVPVEAEGSSDWGPGEVQTWCSSGHSSVSSSSWSLSTLSSCCLTCHCMCARLASALTLACFLARTLCLAELLAFLRGCRAGKVLWDAGV